MIKIENYEVVGWEHAIRGMRNPMNSWDMSDSAPRHWNLEECEKYVDCHMDYCVGENDLDLMKRLRNAGTDHRKFMRMLTVYVDITAPLYWWKEFDTYKVGTVANSCSTMHKIHAKEFTIDDFSVERLYGMEARRAVDSVINALNRARDDYQFCVGKLNRADLTDSEKRHVRRQKKYFFDTMIQLLPTSYNQKRTVMLNYEVLANMYRSRKNHKLDEWHDLCHWIESLPYSDLIVGE